MAFYSLDRVRPAHTDGVMSSFPVLRTMGAGSAERIAKAWAITWANSSFDRLGDVPTSLDFSFPLVEHVNEVAKAGLSLAALAREMWGLESDTETLLSIFLLHDVDKPMLFERTGAGFAKTEISRTVPHGVLGGFILSDLGFSDLVVSTVTTHGTDAPFHGSSREAWLLHYADMFTIDKTLAETGKTPFYQRPLLLR